MNLVDPQRHGGIRRRRPRAGFSLIEVMVAAVIIGFGIIAVYNVMPALVRYETLSLLKIRGALMAQSLIDVMKSLDYTEIQSSDEGNFATDVFTGEPLFDADMWGATDMKWSYTSTDNFSVKGLSVDQKLIKKVELQVGAGSDSQTYIFFVTDKNNED